MMLVLSRKAGERILIGPDIEITIVRLQGNTVRIGVEAPPEMAVVREELKGRIEAEAADAAAGKLSRPLPNGLEP